MGVFNSVNKIIFDVGDYEAANIFDARKYMYEDISKQIEILMKNNYVAVLERQDKDLVAITFNKHNNSTKSFSTNPYWLEEKEFNYLVEKRKAEQQHEVKLP